MAKAATGEILDLNKLSPEARAKVARAMNPRDTMFARRFNKEHLKNWNAAAKRTGKSLTEWIEDGLNELEKKS